MNDEINNLAEPPDAGRVDRATAARLAKLRALPVDTARLDERLRAQIGLPIEAASDAVPRMRINSFRRYGTVAAAILIVAVIGGALLTSSSGPALASAAQMAQVHEDMVAGRTSVMQVDSLEEAGRMLSRDWPQSPDLPGVPRNHVMACCMKSVRDKKMACVLLKAEGVPITMAVANAADMRIPASPSRMRGGFNYHIQSAGRLNMVMTERHGRWVCLIAELPVERMMDFADELRF